MTFLQSSQNDFQKWLKEREQNPQLELEFRFGRYHSKKHNFISDIPHSTWLKVKDVLSKNKNLEKINSLLSIQCRQENIRKETFFKKDGDKNHTIDRTEYLIKRKISTKDFKENGVRFSVQKESPVPKHFHVDKVCFQNCNRIKNRYQFVFKGFVVDMTEVRHAHNNECLDDFKEILSESYEDGFYNQYEIEIEVDNIIPNELINDILQIIQSNNNLNKNKSSIPNYLRRFIRSKTNQVIGLQIKDIPTISTNHSITDKADGNRHFLFVQDLDKGLLFNKHFQIKNIKFSSKKTNIDNQLPFCLEGEYLRVNGKPSFFIFDIFLLSGSSQITSKTQIERIAEIDKLMDFISSASGYNITLKKFYFYGKDYGLKTGKTLFETANDVWEINKFPYHLDGLIFTPQNEDYYGKIYKWKPPNEKSIDFFIKFNGTEPFSFSAGLTQQILHLTLYVVLSRKKDTNNLLDVHKIKGEFPQYSNSNTLPLIFQDETKHILGKTKLICDIKEVNGFPTAFCNDVPILHQTVVEFIWKPSENQGNGSGPWLPIKVRKDKTQDFLLGAERGEFIGPNSYKTAIETWKGIQEEFPLALLKNLS